MASIEGITELEPATWYKATARCNTETCDNYNTVYTLERFYSNNGFYLSIQCYPCQQDMEILTAVKLDPQPEPE